MFSKKIKEVQNERRLYYYRCSRWLGRELFFLTIQKISDEEEEEFKIDQSDIYELANFLNLPKNDLVYDLKLEKINKEIFNFLKNANLANF